MRKTAKKKRHSENSRDLTKNGRRRVKPIDIYLLILAAITLINYVTYFIHMLFFPESRTAYIVASVVILITLLPILFRKPLKKLFGRLFKAFKFIWGAGLTFYVISFAVMCAVIFIGAGIETPASEIPEGTVFIVYGAKVQGPADSAYPGSVLKRRLDHAYEVMKDVPDAFCIVSGGQGKNENAAEGDVMKWYLVNLGMDDERIFVDGKSKNTLENVINSKEIIQTNNLSDRRIACVSTGFHIPRIRYLCAREGLTVSYCYYAPSPNPVSLYTSLVREYMSYGKLVLTGHL